MVKRTAYRILLLLLCLSGWQTPAVAAVETPVRREMLTPSSVDRPADRPQWQDIGMRDVLAITGGSSLTPPTTVRVVHESPVGFAPSLQSAVTRHYGFQSLSAYSHCRAVRGYIYLIRCLRL